MIKIQIELLHLKNIIIKIKNLECKLDRLDTSEERIRKLDVKN
jgi:hypothetical protein